MICFSFMFFVQLLYVFDSFFFTSINRFQSSTVEIEYIAETLSSDTLRDSPDRLTPPEGQVPQPYLQEYPSKASHNEHGALTG